MVLADVPWQQINERAMINHLDGQRHSIRLQEFL